MITTTAFLWREEQQLYQFPDESQLSVCVCVCLSLRPCIDGVKKIVLLRAHPQSWHTVHRPIDHCRIGTCQVLSHERKPVMDFWHYNDKSESFDGDIIFNHLLPRTYPLELILQNTGDVEAEVGPKCQQTVEQQHHEAVICCGEKKRDNRTSGKVSLNQRKRHKHINSSQKICDYFIGKPNIQLSSNISL